MDHPYKELSYVFVEILNYHSHTDRNLTVNLMEGTVTYFGLKQGNIVNMTNVSMSPYSMTSSEPEKATIVIKDEIEIVKSPSTIFNIMKAFEQRISPQEALKVTLSMKFQGVDFFRFLEKIRQRAC